MAGPRGREKVRREAHWDPPQRRGGSGKGAEGRSLPSGSEGSEREHLSPGSVPLPPEAGRLCARGTGPVTCSCGGRNCVICLLLPSRILCPSLSPLFLSVISLHLLRDGGVPGLLRWLSLESPGSLPGTRGAAGGISWSIREMGGEGKVTLLCGGLGEFREPSGGSGRNAEQKPRGGAHHSPSGADWCGRGFRG